MNFHRTLFNLLSTAGRRFGGIGPYALTNWAGSRGYADSLPGEVDYRWIRDRRGDKFLLNPFFLIDRQVIAFGDYDPALHQFIDKHVEPGMVCFDVGANIGLMSVHMARRVGPAGAVYSFEPVPVVHQRLVQNVSENGLVDTVHLHEVALSNADGNAEIHYGNENWQNQGMASLVSTDFKDVQQTCIVETAKLDSFVASHGVERIDFIKIDIEGAEPLFLEGARGILESMQPILSIEVSASVLRSLGDLSPRDLIESLEDLGYSLFEIREDGEMGRQIDHRSIPEDYNASNVCAWPSAK